MAKKQKLEASTKRQMSAKDKELFALINRCEVLQEELKEIIKKQNKRWGL